MPMFNATAKKASSLLDRVRPRRGGGRVGEVIDKVKNSVERVEELTRETNEAFDMFRPFTSRECLCVSFRQRARCLRTDQRRRTKSC